MNASDHDRRLEEVVAFALGALDAEQVDDFEVHLAGCERCQEELRWLAPAVQALSEAIEPRKPPPEVKQRLMAEVRADAEATERQARAEERRDRGEERAGFGEWLRGLRVGGLTWKPLTGLAAVVLIVAAGVGYAVGTGGGSGAQTTKVPGPHGVVAEVVTEGDKGELRLTGVSQLPKGKVLEAWVRRGKSVEAVPALFAPDSEGKASTVIENMSGVSLVMVTREPQGGTKAPTSEPIAEVPLAS